MAWPQALLRGSAWDWDPFRELDRMQGELDKVWSRANDSYAPGFPPVDVWANEDEALVTAELPGVEPDGIDISVTGEETLTISGARRAAPAEHDEGGTWLRRERGYGEFQRTVRLPFKVDSAAVEARFKDGVLSVKLPKSGAERPRRIAVTAH
ncbi:MAG TPA: Hsp20/alpha crystallin family protein [Candidatus Binatia bacterium]|nr:Hsp20/alpha crystallin family protein [Candidatus Binatia bacterium]